MNSTYYSLTTLQDITEKSIAQEVVQFLSTWESGVATQLFLPTTDGKKLLGYTQDDLILLAKNNNLHIQYALDLFKTLHPQPTPPQGLCKVIFI